MPNPPPQQTTKHPAVAIRGEVLRDAFEAIPFVRAYRRYQQECISRARCRYPDDTRNLTDGEVWRNLVTPDSSGG